MAVLDPIRKRIRDEAGKGAAAKVGPLVIIAVIMSAAALYYATRR